ncbi:DUF1398 domain-containing protein [Polaribacter gangjinensis]|uniref:Phage envelope protein n=1 Tax=Polaribacter gangjinensis TaxID=574710 RepID=A0A2S7WA61_9FLAO|nr:DUF1398 family protein [Polaribacter gangjinensis]PQJ74509.1 phage envelope protein [Polaribacter gangjinensis]
MFTINQIKETHSKVKSGADFPNFIKELKQMGVIGYETFVADGHTIYNGKNGFTIQTEPKYSKLEIAAISNKNQFLNDLKNHQNGNTDYPTFCSDCAASGIEKWVVDLQQMTCVYFDKAATEILVEKIPTA